VAGKQIPLSEAQKILRSVEEKHTEGSAEARHAVDDAVRERCSPRKRRRRGPRLPNFDANETSKPPRTFWSEVKQLVLKWALKETGIGIGGMGDMLLHAAVSECAADVRAAVDELKRKAEKQATTAARFATYAPNDRLPRINALMRELGLEPVRRGQPIDLASIKKAHKRLAREYHPDFTANDPARTKKFVEKQTVYKELMGLVEAQNDAFNRAVCA